jgi:hypothetical protein
MFFVFRPLLADYRADGHDRPGQSTTSLSSFGNPCSRSTSRLKDFFASHIQFFLQSCKNALRSPKAIHVVLQRQFKDFVKQLSLLYPMSSSLDFVFVTQIFAKN